MSFLNKLALDLLVSGLSSSILSNPYLERYSCSENSRAIVLTKFLILVRLLQKTWLPRSSDWLTSIKFSTVLRSQTFEASTKDSAIIKSTVYVGCSAPLLGSNWHGLGPRLISFAPITDKVWLQVIAGVLLILVWLPVSFPDFNDQINVQTFRLMPMQEEWRSSWRPIWSLLALKQGNWLPHRHFQKVANLCTLQKSVSGLFIKIMESTTLINGI